MQTKIHWVLLTCSLLALSACQKQAKETIPTISTPTKTAPILARTSADLEVPLAQAEAWTRRWRNTSKDEAWWEENLFHGFTVPTAGVEAILAQEAPSIRSYMAIDEAGAQHLLLVGVDAEGNDMLDEEAGQGMYNLISPCPQDCDYDSPLLQDELVRSTIEPTGNQITLETANTWTKRWRDTPKEEAWWAEHPFQGFTIPSSNFSDLLSDGAIQFRLYLAIKPDLGITIVEVGVDENGRDMVDEAIGQRVNDLSLPVPPFGPDMDDN